MACLDLSFCKNKSISSWKSTEYFFFFFLKTVRLPSVTLNFLDIFRRPEFFKDIFSRLLDLIWNVAHHFRHILQNYIFFSFCITFTAFISVTTRNFVLPLFLSTTGYFVLLYLFWFWSVTHFRFSMWYVVPFPFRHVVSVRLRILFFLSKWH